MAQMPMVDPQRCTGCGICVIVCYCEALALVGNVVTIIETEECGYCTQCEAVCPTGAISCPYEIVVEG